MKKLKRLVSSIMIIMTTILTFGMMSSVNAESAGPIYLGIVALRSSGHGYIQSEKKVWKIAEYENATDTSAKPDLTKTIYCIKAGVGFGSSNLETGGAPTISTYTQKFNLRNITEIEEPYSTALPTGENYNKLMWILDHLYIMPDPEVDNSENRNQFLSEIIPDKQYELLTDDDIDAIQQLAIWYYTNPTGIYHNEDIELHTNRMAEVDDAYGSFEDIYGRPDGWDRQDAAKALYKYYINTAKADYVSTEATTAPVELIDANAKMQKIGDNYVAGPYKVNELLNVNYTITATYTDMENHTITPSLAIKNADNAIVNTDKTLKELVGTEFYLSIPVSSNITGIKMNMISSYQTREISYWSVENAPETEQPVVIIDEAPHNFPASTSVVVPKPFDLALRKFITGVNNVKVTDREPDVDVTDLKAGRSLTATYNHTKEPVRVAVGDIVEYTIRVYNEGDVDGYVEEITDHLPDQLEFLPDDSTNQKYGWGWVSKDDLKTVKTSYLSQKNELTPGGNKISAFDGDDLDYRDVKIRCKVIATSPMAQKITNIADITAFTDGEGNVVTDRDSQEKNVNVPTGTNLENYKDQEINRGEEFISGQQDDDDFEKLVVKEFDLSLRKFITAVNTTQITTREPQVDVTPLKDETGKTAIYNHPKDPVLVSNGNIVTYTIRVYNEGQIDGYAQVVKDDIPEGLKFLPENDTNKEYRWVMLDEDGNETTEVDDAKSIITDYLSKEQENDGDNLIKAFDGTKLSYKDVKVAFEVVEPNTSDRIIINQAQISEDADENGRDVNDRDSTPDVWNEGEDDQDIEKIKVQYFDLSLRKWVTQAIVIRNGEETITETGHKAEDDPEAIVKVDLKKSNINKVTVKFRYKIRVTNEGKIAGYAKEIKDYIPKGLKFVQEDNPLWKQLDDNTIVTEQTKDILLQPGESTEVEVLLTWINDEDNMGVMDNWAEISEDYNEFNSPDIDSTPNNRKEGEDDIDDAPVMITVQTGQVRTYTTITLAVLTIITSGVILIKKYVL